MTASVLPVRSKGRLSNPRRLATEPLKGLSLMMPLKKYRIDRPMRRSLSESGSIEKASHPVKKGGGLREELTEFK
jgi:hypothetical protein